MSQADALTKKIVYDSPKLLVKTFTDILQLNTKQQNTINQNNNSNKTQQHKATQNNITITKKVNPNNRGLPCKSKKTYTRV